MDNGTAFYIVGPLLAASAVVVSFIGLKSEKFPGRFGPLVALWFVLLVFAATTLAVRHSRDEESQKEQASGLPHATEAAEEAEAQ